MATETKSIVVKVKPSNQDGSSKGKVDYSAINKKKIESSSKQPVNSKQKFVTTATKTEVPISKGHYFFLFESDLFLCILLS